jgi:copper transport protein
MAALWIGGLAQFFGIIRLVQRTVQPAPPFVGRLAGYFSNYARLAVGGMTVTGLYASWLFVGTLEGLLTTLYGRSLLVKLSLVAPLLAIAGFNLVVTQRRLQAGSDLWVGRLRDLVAAEIALALGVLAAVGLMTSISPARSELNERAALEARAQAAVATPAPQPIHEMVEVDDLLIQLDISPGWVGENTFTVTLTSGEENQPVLDASLIRMRFDHQTENLGQSELRIIEGQDGRYSVSGANLSAPGDWRIRITVQRPDEFDAVVDFEPHIEPQPPPPAPPPMVIAPPSPYRTPVLMATGLLTLALGAYTLSRQRFRIWQGMGALAVALVVVGGLFLVTAVLT